MTRHAEMLSNEDELEPGDLIFLTEDFGIICSREWIRNVDTISVWEYRVLWPTGNTFTRLAGNNQGYFDKRFNTWCAETVWCNKRDGINSATVTSDKLLSSSSPSLENNL